MFKKINEIKTNNPIKRLHLDARIKKIKALDAGVATAFVAAIAILLLVAGYVISRLTSDRAYREKWQDYNDCGLV